MTFGIESRSGRYRYLPGGSAFSKGLAAQPGHRIVEWQFAEPLPLDTAFDRVGDELRDRGLDWGSLAGVELRSAGQFDPAAFAAFNESYLAQLGRYYPLAAEASCPLARTNVVSVAPVAPVHALHAVQVLEPVPVGGGRDFVMSGVAELRGAPDPANVVALHDLSSSGLQAKVDFVRAALAQNCVELGVATDAPNGIDVYTERSIDGLEAMLAETFGAAGRHGLHRWLARPPVVDLDFELGVKRLSAREVLD